MPTLSTAKYLTDTADAAWRFNTETGWQAVATGLNLVVRGYVVLLAGSAVAALLLGLPGGFAIPLPFNTVAEHRDTMLLVGVATLALTAVLSYGLVLAGQWHCLMYAPQTQSAKELMYVSLNCVLVGAGMNVAGVWLGGGELLGALREGTGGLQRLDFTSAGVVLQIGSGLVGLIGSLVFSQFLRNVAGCFGDQARVRGVDLNLAFVGLLVGGAVGVVLCVGQAARAAELVPPLAAGALACFAWHLGLVNGVRRCVVLGLLRAAERARIPVEAGGRRPMHTLSAMRRLVRSAKG
jgi:hypothetical protein